MQEGRELEVGRETRYIAKKGGPESQSRDFLIQKRGVPKKGVSRERGAKNLGRPKERLNTTNGNEEEDPYVTGEEPKKVKKKEETR